MWICSVPRMLCWEFLPPLCVSASSGRVSRLKCLGLFLTLFHRLIQSGKIGEAGRGVLQSSRAVTCALCRALAELRSMVGREKQGLFLDHILMEKMSHQLRQETQGGVSSRVRGIPLECIARFLYFLKRLFQMSLSAGLSNKQPGV